jgi:hypothetical protein
MACTPLAPLTSRMLVMNRRPHSCMHRCHLLARSAHDRIDLQAGDDIARAKPPAIFPVWSFGRHRVCNFEDAPVEASMLAVICSRSRELPATSAAGVGIAEPSRLAAIVHHVCGLMWTLTFEHVPCRDTSVHSSHMQSTTAVKRTA